MIQPGLNPVLLQVVKTVRAEVDAVGTHTLLVDFRSAFQDTTSLIKMWLIDKAARPTDIPINPVKRVGITKLPNGNEEFMVFYIDDVRKLAPDELGYTVTYDNTEVQLASHHVLQYLETGTYPTQPH